MVIEYVGEIVRQYIAERREELYEKEGMCVKNTSWVTIANGKRCISPEVQMGPRPFTSINQ